MTISECSSPDISALSSSPKQTISDNTDWASRLNAAESRAGGEGSRGAGTGVNLQGRGEGVKE